MAAEISMIAIVSSAPVLGILSTRPIDRVEDGDTVIVCVTTFCDGEIVIVADIS